MASVIIPVLLSLFLGPGVGQLYNREFKKASFLIIMSLVIAGAATMWLQQVAQPYLPTDMLQLADPDAIKQAAQNAVTHVIGDHRGTFTVYGLLFTGLWIYSVVDAYLGAIRRKKEPVVS